MAVFVLSAGELQCYIQELQNTLTAYHDQQLILRRKACSSARDKLFFNLVHLKIYTIYSNVCLQKPVCVTSNYLS